MDTLCLSTDILAASRALWAVASLHVYIQDSYAASPEVWIKDRRTDG